MRKMIAVLKREYFQAVRKKSFIILTLLMPVLFAGMMLVPALLATGAMSEKTIVVIDGTGRLENAVSGEMPSIMLTDDSKAEVAGEETATDEPEPASAGSSAEIARRSLDENISTTYVDASGAADLREIAQSYIDRMASKDESAGAVDGVMIIPADAFSNSDSEMNFYSRSATDMIARERLARVINKEIQRTRLAERGIGPSEADSLLKAVRANSVQVTKSGEEKKGGDMSFLFAFVFAGLLIFPTVIYGQEVMRGIVQEKTDRVVEILISSMSPMQLLSGKIIGLAMVGLTQLAVWVVMAFIISFLAGPRIPSGLAEDLAFVKPVLAIYFVVFFVLAYLIYVCFYAIAGAACNNEKEAQQFAGPIVILLMIPWILMMPILLNPESTMAIALSLIPLFAPVTMFARLVVSEPAFWQIAVAIIGSAAFIIALFWVTAKIFRVGILSYGKRPTIPELWRWLKVA